MITIPIHIEVADETQRRASESNEVRITLFDQSVPSHQRYPLFSFSFDRRQLAETLLSGGGSLEKYIIPGKMLSS